MMYPEVFFFAYFFTGAPSVDCGKFSPPVVMLGVLINPILVPDAAAVP